MTNVVRVIRALKLAGFFSRASRSVRSSPNITINGKKSRSPSIMRGY